MNPYLDPKSKLYNFYCPDCDLVTDLSKCPKCDKKTIEKKYWKKKKE